MNKEYAIPDYKYELINSRDFYEGELLIQIRVQRAIKSEPKDIRRWKKKD